MPGASLALPPPAVNSLSGLQSSSPGTGSMVMPRGQFARMSVSMAFTTSGDTVLRLSIMPANRFPQTALNLRLVQPLPALHLVFQKTGNEARAPAEVMVISIDCDPDELADNPESQKGTPAKSSGESEPMATRTKNRAVPLEPDSEHLAPDAPEETDRGADNARQGKAGTSDSEHKESLPGDKSAQYDSDADTACKKPVSQSALSSEQEPDLSKQSENNRADHNTDNTTTRKSASGDQSSARQAGREGTPEGKARDTYNAPGSDKSMPRGPGNTGNASSTPNNSSQNANQSGQTLLNNLAALINPPQPQMMEGPKQPPVIILNNSGPNNRSSDRRKSRREEEKEKEKERERQGRERSAKHFDDGLDN